MTPIHTKISYDPRGFDAVVSVLTDSTSGIKKTTTPPDLSQRQGVTTGKRTPRHENRF